ncbi:hypothetical protein DCCM_3631 [Desulfocucumis palustris]|uniref:Uncharacterized protein n=1 Tax=Desulfocucumis palustris TaxID=1898651 RepID=A0A2L2XFN8_9FIRM|nr:hypothetical protein [Desulfocucumis palustris]GBF34513.1 hypothetical protein DCCM_3631 [Desulfocucumis palustris]
MRFYKSIQRYCKFIDCEATIQVRETAPGPGRTAAARQKYACRTAREGNLMVCRNARCKFVNGGRGEDPFILSRGHSFVKNDKRAGRSPF